MLTFRKGDYGRAISLLKESSLARQEDAELWYYLGLAQWKAKDLPGSRQSLEKAIKLGLAEGPLTEAKRLLVDLK